MITELLKYGFGCVLFLLMVGGVVAGVRLVVKAVWRVWVRVRGYND